MKEKPVEVHDLSFGYEKRAILNKVNLSVDPGEFIAIFGPNGGGKTTFLKLLMGFLKPGHGKISIFGSSPKKARQEIGYVPQVTQFDKQFPVSVLDLVLMGCLSQASWFGGFSKEIRKKAEAALDLVGLLGKKDQAFGTLSGGQAQRALIARGLVSNPKLLLLDEPTANVDPEAETQIYDLLLSLKGTITIFMVTHNLQGIIKKADRLFCVHRTVTSYTPKEVCEHFAVGLYHPPKTHPTR